MPVFLTRLILFKIEDAPADKTESRISMTRLISMTHLWLCKSRETCITKMHLLLAIKADAFHFLYKGRRALALRVYILYLLIMRDPR
jgi:hypothetical protein